MTTRVCHSKSVVEIGERTEVGIKKYERNIPKFVATPAACRRHHVELEEKLQRLEKFSNETDLNFTVMNKDAKIGVITSGISFEYAKEVFGQQASYLKLGFTYPIPKQMIKEFAANYDTLYVVEENDPYLETQIKALGISVLGKEKIPITGELNPEIIASSLLSKRPDYVRQDKELVKGRPPTLCSGCPHRGLFFELSKRKDAVITGDIGCYTLGSADPLNAMDSVICMGAGVSAAHGFAKVFEQTSDKRKVFGVVGDSTFFHSGITSLIDIVYNQSDCTIIILDNRVTGMTGHQENPGTGYTLKGKKAPIIEIEPLVKSIGIEDVRQVNPNDLKDVREALNAASVFEGPSVIITKWPCALKKLHEEEKKEYPVAQWVYRVDPDKCTKCRICLKVGCPSISSDPQTGSYIDPNTCVGCSVCAQVCSFDAIEKVGDA
jgi:indolepyruvate ferredoxin oxidoreductase alpha subunit